MHNNDYSNVSKIINWNFADLGDDCNYIGKGYFTFQYGKISKNIPSGISSQNGAAHSVLSSTSGYTNQLGFQLWIDLFAGSIYIRGKQYGNTFTAWTKL